VSGSARHGRWTESSAPYGYPVYCCGIRHKGLDGDACNALRHRPPQEPARVYRDLEQEHQMMRHRFLFGPKGREAGRPAGRRG
jgi:hypothetical protein